MKRLSILCLLLFSTIIPAQDEIVLGPVPAQEELDAARNVITAASPKLLTLAVDEYQVVIPAKTLTGPLLYVASDWKVLNLIPVAANQPFTAHIKLKGDKAATLHRWTAKPYSWAIVGGKSPGGSTTSLVGNGKTLADAPVLIDQLEVTVTGSGPAPPPPPVDPVPDPNDTLVKAFRADIAAGKGSQELVNKWIALTRTSANAVKGGQQFATTEDWYNALAAAGRATLGDPLQVLPSLRRAVADELNAAIPRLATTPFEPVRQTVVDKLNSLASRVEGK